MNCKPQAFGKAFIFQRLHSRNQSSAPEPGFKCICNFTGWKCTGKCVFTNYVLQLRRKMSMIECGKRLLFRKWALGCQFRKHMLFQCSNLAKVGAGLRDCTIGSVRLKCPSSVFVIWDFFFSFHNHRSCGVNDPATCNGSKTNIQKSFSGMGNKDLPIGHKGLKH